MGSPLMAPKPTVAAPGGRAPASQGQQHSAGAPPVGQPD